MKLNPQQAPLYGECLLTVQLCEEDRFDKEDDVEFYLFFAGTSQRHLTSTQRVNHVTLHAICPAHDCCESVQVTLCSAKPGCPVDSVAEDRLLFVQDLAFDMAQFLVSTAGRTDALEGTRMLDEFQISSDDSEQLDENLTLALRHLTLPEGWSVLGTHECQNSEPLPQETLLHFAARRGLRRLALFLLQQPGGRASLRLPNKQGATPVTVAQQRGHSQLEQLFTQGEAEVTLPGSPTEASRQLNSGDHLVKYNPRLKTYTITVGIVPGAQPVTIEKDVEELRKFINSHTEQKCTVSSQSSSILLNAGQESTEKQTGGDTVTEQHSLQQISRDSLDTNIQDSTPKSATEEIKDTNSCQCSKAVACESKTDLAPNPQASDSPLNNGNSEDRVCLSENSKDYTEREEGEVGISDASVEDSGKRSDKCDTVQSQTESENLAFSEQSNGNHQEETDLTLSVISTGQGSLGKADKESQEGKQAGVGLSETTVEKLTEDKPQTDKIVGSLEGDMGQTRSQDHSEITETEIQISEQPLEPKGPSNGEDFGDIFVQEREDETETSDDMDISLALQALFSPDFPIENGHGDHEFIADVSFACSCTTENCQNCVKKKCELKANCSEQSQEEAASDYFHENECSDSEVNDNKSLESEGDTEACSGSCLKHVLDTGNPHELPSGTTESASISDFDLPNEDNMKECRSEAEVESSYLAISVNSSDVLTETSVQLPFSLKLLSSQALASRKGYPSLDSPADEFKHHHDVSPEAVAGYEEPPSTENDSTSFSLLDVDSTRETVEHQGNLNTVTITAEESSGTVSALDNVETLSCKSKSEEQTDMPTSEDTSIANDSGESDMSAKIKDMIPEKDSSPETSITPSSTDSAYRSSCSLLSEDEISTSLDTVGSSSVGHDLLHLLKSTEETVTETEGNDAESDQTAAESGVSASDCVEDSHPALDKEGEARKTAEDEVDFRRTSPCIAEEVTRDNTMIHREKDSFYPIDSCTQPVLLEQKHTSESTECLQSPEGQQFAPSAVSVIQRESGSDADIFSGTDTGDDHVFGKQTEEAVTGESTSEVSVSCSSTDESPTPGPPTSTPERSSEVRSWSTEELREGAERQGAAGCETEEEENDRLTQEPLRSSLLRSTIRSLSPFRRHSWGPGKNPGGEAEMNQRSSLRGRGDVVRKPPIHRRSMSWCPSDVPLSLVVGEISSRSYSLEGLSADQGDIGKESPSQGASPHDSRRTPLLESSERGSLVSLTEEEQESDLGENSSLDSQPLTKSVSLLTISQTGLDTLGRSRPKRRISFSFNISPLLPKSKTVFSIGSSSSDEEESDNIRSSSISTSSSLAYSISEEDRPHSPVRKELDGKSGTKVSRTFSYLKNKMYSSKKTKEKDKDKIKEKEKETKEKEKDKKTLNGHLFSTVSSSLPAQCYQCNKTFNAKEASLCANCNLHVHKGCRENLPVCAKVKMKQQKQQFAVPDAVPMAGVTLRNKTTLPRERPRSAISILPDETNLLLYHRRHTSITPFSSSKLSKSISISNIAGPAFDEMPLKMQRYLSQSTDSLHKTNTVNESTESLTDEGTEMMDSQLMGEFEMDAKDLEADSWSLTVDKKLVSQLKKEMIKRQDVIYELIQTEMHHVRTLKIMSDVYSKGLQKEVQLEQPIIEKIFPMLEDLLDIHTQFFNRILERKRESVIEGKKCGVVIHKLGDILNEQFSGPNAERMKKVYGKFCSRHSEAVNNYKELLAKDKRFQAFIKKKMSSSIVRRLGIPECILLVTQRITKYPVLLQRILQHTKDSEEDHTHLKNALWQVKEVITAVDSKVNEHEKKKRLKEVYSRTDSKSIMRMKNGQMFAREDLIRRKLLHDGPLQLKNSAGRLKDVQALLLSDVIVLLQEKDQKYVFASLDQRSTVISLQKLIVREMANEEKGLFLITAGIEKPEMVEVYTSSKDERNTWMKLIQDAMHSMEKDEDEGIPSETEEDKKILEAKTREMREQLREKDKQIMTLLREKVKLFKDMCECGRPDETALSTVTRVLFRASTEDMLKGEPLLKDALKEVEMLQMLVSGSLGGAIGQQVSSNLEAEVSVGPVSLPRRAETFGGFDSHQMNASKNGEKDEGEESPDLRRTESDGVLKKGGNANLLLLLKRNSEVLHSVSRLYELLSALQAVVVRQDAFIEDQRQAPSERPISRTFSRPNSLIEQEKQRSLQKHQAAYEEEKKRWDRECEARKKELNDREARLNQLDSEKQQGIKEVERDREELKGRKEEYQRDLERLKKAQRQLDKDRENICKEQERIDQMKQKDDKLKCRTPSSTSDDSLKFPSTSSLDRDTLESDLLPSPKKDSLARMDSKQKGKNLNLFTFNQSHKASSSDGQNQMPSRLLQLTKSKEKKEKKKKKNKGQHSQPADSQHPFVPERLVDGEIFC
ncbi:A-kinase anchor protein 13 isoform X4 [Amia ocellicauda]|uniref:A-kinase anchor protein 13 isoform X4 n=1 Tax=Amia ocellicauda TaxID=2972642 RepID=UPI003463F98D